MSNAGATHKDYEALKAWYLARLRKSALEAAKTNLTPLALIKADRRVVERLIAERSAEQSRATEQRALEQPQQQWQAPGWMQTAPLSKSYACTTLIVCFLQLVPLCLIADLAARSQSEYQTASAILIISVFCIVTTLVYSTVMCVVLDRFVFAHLSRLASILSAHPKIAALPGGTTGNEILSLEQTAANLSKALDAAVEREAAIADYSTDLLVSMDSAGHILAASPSVANLWRYQPQQLPGMQIKAIVDADDVDKTTRAIAAACSGQGKTEIENRIICSNGEKKDMQWSFEWSATQRTLFCLARDITATKEIERMKQEFFAMISHDLRTPLASVLGSIQMLEALVASGEETLSARSRHLVNISQQNVQRLLTLVNQILDAEKITAGKFVVDLAECDLAQVVEASANTVQGLAQQHEVKLEWHADEAMAMAMADECRLVQAVVNLLSNAIKFSPAHSTVKMSLERTGGLATIRVSDEGPGIPLSQRNRLFERFHQLNTPSQLPGSGLGLSICRDIVLAHKGEIGVDSEQGKGSTFWIKLPVIQRDQ